jgi:hypothetical protein
MCSVSQEVGAPEAVADLVALLDGDWHTALSAHFDPRHRIRVGFLSRHPLRVVADLAAFPPRLAPLQARRRPCQGHHPDGPRRPRDHREGVTVRGLADTLLDGQGSTTPLVLLGDLNDAPEAATTQVLLGPPGLGVQQRRARSSIDAEQYNEGY